MRGSSCWCGRLILAAAAATGIVIVAAVVLAAAVELTAAVELAGGLRSRACLAAQT